MPSRSVRCAPCWSARRPASAACVVLAVVADAAGSDRGAERQRRRTNFDPSDFVARRPKLDAPYVVTDYEVVDAMLAMAEVRPDDHVDRPRLGRRPHPDRGRAQPRRARPWRRHRSRRESARPTPMPGAAGVADRVQFRREDLFQTPLAEADVLTLYLTAEVNLRLRPRILAQMRPGARVVSHDFDMGDWRPDQRQQDRLGDASISGSSRRAFAGGWTLNADGRTATLELEQHYQQLDGTHRRRRRRPDRAGTAGRRAGSASSPISATAGASSKAGSTATASIRSEPGAGWQAVAPAEPTMPLALDRPRPRLGGDAAVRRDGVRPRPASLLYAGERPGLADGGALADRAGRRPRSCSPPPASASASCWSAANGAPPLLLPAITLTGRLLVELQKDWTGALRPDAQGHLVAGRFARFPERPCRQRHHGLAVPGPAAAARRARPRLRGLGGGLAGAGGRAEPGHARRPLAERRDRRLGVRPVLDAPAASPVRPSPRRGKAAGSGRVRIRNGLDTPDGRPLQTRLDAARLPEHHRQIVGRHRHDRSSPSPFFSASATTSSRSRTPPFGVARPQAHVERLVARRGRDAGLAVGAVKIERRARRQQPSGAAHQPGRRRPGADMDHVDARGSRRPRRPASPPPARPARSAAAGWTAPPRRATPRSSAAPPGRDRSAARAASGRSRAKWSTCSPRAARHLEDQAALRQDLAQHLGDRLRVARDMRGRAAMVGHRPAAAAGHRPALPSRSARRTSRSLIGSVV